MLVRTVPRFISNLLFRSFESKESFLDQVEETRKRYPNRPIAFALLNAGIVEFLALRLFLFQRFGEKDFQLRYATRIKSIFIESASTIFNRIWGFFSPAHRPPSRIKMCSEELRLKHPIILNLESGDRKRAFETPLSETELAYLSIKHPDLIVVPVAFVWRRSRPLEESMPQDFGHKAWKGLWQLLSWPWYVVLGDPYRPTGFRKLLIMLRGYAKSTARIAQALEVKDIDARSLRRKLLQSINIERKTIIGPSFKSTRSIGESLMRSPSFVDFIQTTSLESGVPKMVLLRKADRYFQEMSSKFSYFMIETTAWFLERIFNNIFEGVVTNEEEFKKLREAAKQGTIVYIPSHKSYVDFLLLSYVLFQKAFVPPHIAAGINLNFWPMGKLFKMGGAFFIRRSFRGNVVYSEVLRRYIAELISHGVSVEFFIEGTRSRNGKLAPPKYGILKMMVESHLQQLITRKVRIVPVSIAYEKITEGGAHRRELEGGIKAEENVINTVKSTKVLFKRYGKVHLHFADPIALEEFIKTEIANPSSNPAELKLGIQKLAFEICHRINKETPLTAVGLVCAVMLTKPGSALLKTELQAWLERIHQDVQTLNIFITPDLQTDFMKACRRAIARLLDERVIEKYFGVNENLGFRLPRKQRISALYYKNSVVHAFTKIGILGLSHGSSTEALELRSLFQFEFFFEEKESFLKSLGEQPSKCMSSFYALWFDDILENLLVGLNTLKAEKNSRFDQKEWRSRFMKFGRTAILESTLSRPESVNTQSFSAFIGLATNRNWLLPVAGNDALWTPGDIEKIDLAVQRIQYFKSRLESWDKLKQDHLQSLEPDVI